MRRMLVVIGVVLTAGAAIGQTRPSTTTMSCGDVQALLAAKSAVVLSTGERTFDRFYATRLFCSLRNEEAVVRVAPTTDNPECRIGYTCQQRPDSN